MTTPTPAPVPAPGSGFTSTKAIAATAATIVTAFIGVLVAAGLHVRPELRDSIVTFITAVTPVAIVVYGRLHHSHTQVARALYAYRATQPAPDVPGQPSTPRRRAPHTA